MRPPQRINFERFMRQALRCGLSVGEFWDLTPREAYMAIEAATWRAEREREQMLSLAWHTAALVRTKRLPALKALIAGTKAPKKLSDKELAERRQEFGELKEQVDLRAINRMKAKR